MPPPLLLNSMLHCSSLVHPVKPIVTLLFLITLATQLAAAKAPNFVIIYADDLGYADTSVQMMDADPTTRHDFIQTPGLDRLAEMGARFSTAYAPTPTCTGSRLSLQFGNSIPVSRTTEETEK